MRRDALDAGGVVDEREHRPHVADDVGELARGVRGIGRHHDGAEPQDRDVRQHRLDRRRAREHDAVADGHTRCGQPPARSRVAA